MFQERKKVPWSSNQLNMSRYRNYFTYGIPEVIQCIILDTAGMNIFEYYFVSGKP